MEKSKARREEVRVKVLRVVIFYIVVGDFKQVNGLYVMEISIQNLVNYVEENQDHIVKEEILHGFDIIVKKHNQKMERFVDGLRVYMKI